MPAKNPDRATKATKPNSDESAPAKTSAQASPGADTGDDAATLLKAQHQQLKEVLAKAEGGDAAVIDEIAEAWIPHTIIEEEVLVPAALEKGVDKAALGKLEVDRDLAKILLRNLLRLSPGDEQRAATLAVLSRQLQHLMEQEEEPEQGLIALAQKAGVDMAEVGARLRTRLSEINEGDGDRLDVPAPRSLTFMQYRQKRMPQEQLEMARQSTMRERDDQGRFMSDDDDYRGGSSGSRGYRRERDDEGRFTSGNDNGRRYSSSRYDDRDDDRNGGRSRDEEGRFMSGRQGRYDDDDDYRGDRSSRGGQRGWSGDPEGHSEAARRGWEGRGRTQQRYEDNDDRRRPRSGDYDDDRMGSGRGHGGWSGDPAAHSEASRRGWEERTGMGSRSRSSRYDEDDDRTGSRRGRGGWFADAEGHSEAAHRGWEERQGSRSRSSRYEDDDDDRRRGRQGHGGWYGDPEGHSQAARRGWEDR